jgi:hypothetical protein
MEFLTGIMIKGTAISSILIEHQEIKIKWNPDPNYAFFAHTALPQMGFEEFFSVSFN